MSGKNTTIYQFLMKQKELIEREYAAHYQAHGHDAETCVLLAHHNDVEKQLCEVMKGAING